MISIARDLLSSSLSVRLILHYQDLYGISIAGDLLSPSLISRLIVVHSLDPSLFGRLRDLLSPSLFVQLIIWIGLNYTIHVFSYQAKNGSCGMKLGYGCFSWIGAPFAISLASA